jgi:hypothetical protein
MNAAHAASLDSSEDSVVTLNVGGKSKDAKREHEHSDVDIKIHIHT